MVHDESVYPNPDKFDPERFLNSDGQLSTDDNVLAFGYVSLPHAVFKNVHHADRFGRRTCPGRHAADATVWATIVSVLSVLDIVKAKGAAGDEIEIEPAYSDGLVR